VHLTPNGIDVDRFRPDDVGRKQLRLAEGVAEEICVALFVGGDWAHKGLGLAFEGLAKARAGGADVVLWVVGQGDEARFRRLARRLGVDEALRFFGRRTDTESFYRAADVFVLPSVYETFSIVCFEAAACGLPLVIPPISGAGDLVGKDEAGMVVSRDGWSIASALLSLANDRERRVALGHEARRRASEYTWESSSAEVIGVYRSLLAQDHT